MTVSSVKGWCPSAHRPMPAGDGLIVRIRPSMGRLSADQTHALVAVAKKYADGFISLTNRANLQLRGVSEAEYPALLADLQNVHLVSTDAVVEGRRNIVTSPFWQPGDRTHRIAQSLLDRLGEFPDLPDKFGFAVDLGRAPILNGVSGDIRFEQTVGSDLLLRADGSPTGRVVSEANAVDAALELANWFQGQNSTSAGRMTRLLKSVSLPSAWTGAAPATPAGRPNVGLTNNGILLGATFGEAPADELQRAFDDSGAQAIRVTPWRMFLLEGARTVPNSGFIADPDNALLTIAACAGAPRCGAATVDAHALARRLAAANVRDVHVSGCAKGCARNTPAKFTLVGAHGRFDLVRNGRASDAPARRALTPDTAITEVCQA